MLQQTMNHGHKTDSINPLLPKFPINAVIPSAIFTPNIYSQGFSFFFWNRVITLLSLLRVIVKPVFKKVQWAMLSVLLKKFEISEIFHMEEVVV
jgi:hypothetical protein